MRSRKGLFLIVLLAATASVFGQVTVTQPRAGIFFDHFVTAGDGPFAEINAGFIQTAQSALSLSEAQVNALKALLTMRREAIEKNMQAIEEKQQKLDEVLSQTNPNPTEVGTAFLASRNVEQQMRAADEKFRTDFKALLNASQQASLEKLKATSEQIHGLVELGILEGAAEHEFLKPFH